MKQTDVIALGTALVEFTPQHLGASVAAADAYDALPSGATTNFCLALARLGIHVSLATRIGKDELGQWLLHKLQHFGVDTSPTRTVAGQYTPVSFAWMDQDGAKTFYFYRFPGYSDPMLEFAAEPLTDDELRQAKLFDFSEATVRAEPLRSVSLDTARRARELGLQVAYAVNYRPGAWREPVEQIVAVQRQALALADVALMNREEAALITGDEELRPESLAALGPSLLAITAGGEGAHVFYEGKLTFIPPREVEVRYDIGAGDTFHAGLLAALLHGYEPIEAASLASAAAALRICRTADMSCLPTWAEVLAMATDEGPTLEGAPL